MNRNSHTLKIQIINHNDTQCWWDESPYHIDRIIRMLETDPERLKKLHLIIQNKEKNNRIEMDMILINVAQENFIRFLKTIPKVKLHRSIRLIFEKKYSKS